MVSHTTCIRDLHDEQKAYGGGPDPKPPGGLDLGRACYSEGRKPRSQCAGSGPLPRNSPPRFEHCRRGKQFSTEDMTTSLAKSWCVPRLDPYSNLGTAMSAGQKSSSHSRPRQVASNIVSFVHAPRPLVCAYTAPAP